MTSKRSAKALLKKARLRSEPFKVALGDETLEGTITALPFARWQEIQASHPPRPDNKVDEGWGYSYLETWPDMIRASVTDPDMDDEDWDGYEDDNGQHVPGFFDLLGEGDLSRLALKVITLNETPGAVDLPKPSGTSPVTTLHNSA